ncbi:MAG: hypothetical protein IPL79_14815, partial [Myxococcales bacterium]|nr:hypothetical protein [Myxococcales bacterium]
ALIARDSSGRLRPEPIKRLLTKLDSNSYWFNSMYGIHGIDNNPTVHPFAKLSKMCDACTKNSDCGDNGNLCVKVGDSGKRCVAACTDDRGCGEGYECADLATGNTIFGQACVPETLSCE